MAAAADDVYFTATGEEDGKPLIFRSLKDVPEGVDQADFPYRMTIVWRYDAEIRNGMPDPETNDISGSKTRLCIWT